jgi:hypothetical protein
MSTSTDRREKLRLIKKRQRSVLRRKQKAVERVKMMKARGKQQIHINDDLRYRQNKRRQMDIKKQKKQGLKNIQTFKEQKMQYYRN